MTAVTLETNKLPALVELTIYTFKPSYWASALCLPTAPYVQLHTHSPSIHFPLIHLLVHPTSQKAETQAMQDVWSSTHLVSRLGYQDFADPVLDIEDSQSGGMKPYKRA